jgi:hypothetical protein
MNVCETGLLRCGDDELVVAQLELQCQYDDDQPRDTAELCVLRVGQHWELKQALPRVHVLTRGGTREDNMEANVTRTT